MADIGHEPGHPSRTFFGPEDVKWRKQAACSGLDTSIWYKPDSASGEAKSICGECEPQRQCLEYALAAREVYGVWGGLTTKERNALTDSDMKRRGIDPAVIQQTDDGPDGGENP